MSWNTAMGSGDVEELLRHVMAKKSQFDDEPNVVLLLQEVYRSGPEVPGTSRARARFPRRLGAGVRQGRDVVSLAARLSMNFFYVPSMGNGRPRPGRAGEDRGNAILSTLPLHDLTAIELPFSGQRRVAVAASLEVGGSRVTVVSVHLNARPALSKGSVFSGPAARRIQVAALLNAIDLTHTVGPIIVGGDFNTLAGPREPAIRVMEQRFARLSCGSPITHRWGLSLDYIFASDRSIFRSCSRLAARFESDHHALIGHAFGG